MITPGELHSIFDALPFSIAYLDTDYRFLYANQAFLALTGLPREALIGKPCYETVGEYVEDASRAGRAKICSFCRLDHALISGTPYTIERPLGNKTIRVTTLPEIDAGGHVIRCLEVVEDVTERKKAKTALRNQRMMFESIFENSLAGYWDWNLEEGTEYLSPTFKKMFGYEDHELPNTPETWQNLIFPEDLPGVFEVFRRHVESRGAVPYYNEIRYRHRNGSTVWVVCTGQVIEWNDAGEPLRMAGCHIDITERKRVEEELRESQERFKTISDSLPVAIFETDDEGHILYLNQNWTVVTGIGRSTAMASGWTSALYADDRLRVIEDWAACVRSKTGYTGEFRFTGPSGELKWVSMKTSPLHANDGTIRGHVGVLEDITERRSSEETIKKQRHYDTMERVVRGIAHEIRNPLFGISTIGQILLRENHSAQNQKMLELLMKEVRRINTLITEFNLYGKNIAPRLETIPLRLFLVSVIESVTESRKTTAAVMAEIPYLLSIQADRNKLTCVLTNLLENALDGGASRIEVTAAEREDYTEITVRDNGDGISEAHLASVYEPFFTTKQGSTGLGLSLCKKLIEEHGGSISVASSQGEGTSVTLTLPL